MNNPEPYIAVSSDCSDNATLFRGLMAASRGLMAALICALSMTLIVPEASSADTYYRWKDEQGKLVVSDRPPASEQIEYEVVSQRSSLIRRVKPGEGAVPKEVTPRPGNEFTQVDPRQEEIEVVTKNPESCARAKANLETLNTAARIRIRDKATGELRFISEEEKETQRQKARDTIRVHCA
ncbi:DUF4124 domain-containing protein [Congregibacter sp.]|uniref:DUF4124 domain-containing protein n=1 Tax=Congregibacter sp. TaxID=2744308 RepID=UPI003F6AE690